MFLLKVVLGIVGGIIGLVFGILGVVFGVLGAVLGLIVPVVVIGGILLAPLVLLLVLIF